MQYGAELPDRIDLIYEGIATSFIVAANGELFRDRIDLIYEGIATSVTIIFILYFCSTTELT